MVISQKVGVSTWFWHQIKAESVLLTMIPKPNFTQTLTCSVFCGSASHLAETYLFWQQFLLWIASMGWWTLTIIWITCSTKLNPPWAFDFSITVHFKANEACIPLFWQQLWHHDSTVHNWSHWIVSKESVLEVSRLVLVSRPVSRSTLLGLALGLGLWNQWLGLGLGLEP